MIRVGIIGGAGYTAGELIRLLVNHPEVEISFVNSKSSAGKPLYSVHTGLFGDTEINFTDSLALDKIDVLFLCCAHGQSKAFLEEHDVPSNVKIIDLAQDFRDESNGFTYGLPELGRERIIGKDKIANPGCFATAIQLSLLPAAKAHAIESDIEIVAVTGSTGAGVKPGATTHFSYRTDNLSTYKEFTHQHLLEINRTLKKLFPEITPINFVPMRGDFARGIFVTAHFKTSLSEADAVNLYKDFYKDAKFTFVSESPVDLKQVVNTNKAIMHIAKYGDILHITTAIDNLLKGASGQAVQNMNIIFNLPENEGLKLKASAF